MWLTLSVCNRQGLAALVFSLALIHPSAWRNCLIIPERPHCGLPREVRTEPEASFRRLWWRQSQAFTGPLTIYQTVSRRGVLRSSYTKTCIAPVSSVTNHRRLMYVAILCQLSKHEVCDVLPRYSGGFVRISAEKDLILTRGTLVSDPGWAHDHPL